jgi:hypothetical protein
LALLCVGCAANSTRHLAADERNIQRTKEALITAGDADSLAAAAMFLYGPGDAPSQRLALILRAVAAAPDRADLVWLNLRFCSEVESCDPEPIAARLHALDPANGAAWWVSIARSGKLKDTAAVRRDILAIANSERFDIYWNATILHATNATLKVHTLDTRTALVEIVGSVAAMAIPPYQEISNACKGDQLEDPDVVQICRRVSAAMRQSDMYISEMVGISIAKRVWPQGSPEFLAAADARRLARYRMDTMNKTIIAQTESDQSAETYLELLATFRTEQEVIRAAIVDAGLNPTPPADWADTSES